MKKLIAFILITLAVSAQAQHGHNRHSHPRGDNWVAPVLLGSIIGYGLARNQPDPIYNYVYVPQPTAVIQRPLIVQSICTPWTETQYADGTVTRTRTCQ